MLRIALMDILIDLSIHRSRFKWQIPKFSFTYCKIAFFTGDWHLVGLLFPGIQADLDSVGPHLCAVKQIARLETRSNHQSRQSIAIFPGAPLTSGLSAVQHPDRLFTAPS